MPPYRIFGSYISSFRSTVPRSNHARIQLRLASTSEFNTQGKKTTSEDRTALNPASDEYSKSGGDDAVAQQDKASFDSDDITPEAQKERAGKGNVVNPLEVSPVNLEASRLVDSQEGHPERGMKREKSEKRSPRKARTFDYLTEKKGKKKMEEGDNYPMKPPQGTEMKGRRGPL